MARLGGLRLGDAGAGSIGHGRTLVQPNGGLGLPALSRETDIAWYVGLIEAQASHRVLHLLALALERKLLQRKFGDRPRHLADQLAPRPIVRHARDVAQYSKERHYDEDVTGAGASDGQNGSFQKIAEVRCRDDYTQTPLVSQHLAR